MLKSDYHCKLWMEHLGFAEGSSQEMKEKPLNDQIENDFTLDQPTGEQAGSTPSWIKTAEHMAPDHYNPPPGIELPPTNILDINYVYGYRSYDTRDNLRYNSNGEVVYHTAALGIVLNKTKNTMRVNNTHFDDVTCLDVNIHRNLVATGQLGVKPSLVVWDSNTLETKFIFKNHLERSIANVAISKSGQFVAATSMSDNHDIAVYNLQSNSLVALGRGPKSVIYSIKFNQSEDEVVCACAKEVVFAKFKDGKIECKKGVFGKAPVNANLCVVNLGDSMITSMNNGLLALWKGTSCTKIFKEHNKSVGALCQRSDGGIISGDSEGKIVIWSMNMVKERQLNLQKLMGLKSNNVRIIALCENAGNILVGTRGGEIIEIIKGQSANIIMQGHYDNQLWGLSVSPSRNEFVTGGQDKLLIRWDITKRKLIAKKKLQSPINSVDISRLNVLAVGHKNGVVSFFDYNTFNSIKRISNIKNPDKDMLSIVKFSPDGSVVAVGYCPPISKVYLYSYDTLKKIGECKGSPSRIISIDFSYDGASIMINNTSYEILFFKTNNGAFVGSATSFKGQQWSTLTCRFSWASQGIWPPCSDGSDINTVDRSNSKKYLATGDDFSKVKVFKYPVTVKKQIHNAYKGHSSHVTAVKWTFDDKYLVSTGGLEKSIIQWANDDQPEIIYNYEDEKEQKEQEQEQQEQEEYEYELEPQKQKQQAEQGEFGLEVEEGQQALAVKPFLGQVKASTPSGYKINVKDNKQPQADMTIQHVWGVRNEYIGDRVRKQVKYSNDYESCYLITAALGVEMNIQNKTQSFYKGHQEDLISFSISSDGKYCATGQMAQLNLKKATQKIVDVHVWDAKTKQQLCKLSNFHKRAVLLVQFSPSGKKLLTVGQDDKNSLAVYDWQIKRKAWSSPVCNAKVTGATWKNEQEYMTVGLKHVKFWRMDKGNMGKLTAKTWDPMFSAIYWDGKFVSGGGSGNVYLWGGNIGTPTKGHEGRVDILAVDKNGGLYSGCSKGILIKWKLLGGKLVADHKVLDMSAVDLFDPGLLSIDFSKTHMLVCTNSSSIYQFQLNNLKSSEVIMQSHFKDQLWAAAWSPDGKHFVTGGDDKTVRIYDAITYKMLHHTKMKERVRGLDWEPKEGKSIIVGDYKGGLHLFDTELNLKSSMRTKFSKTKPRKEPFWIEDIKFSPSGQYVAFGAHGGASHLQIYSINDDEIKGPPKIINGLLTSALLSVDWSQGSDMLVIVSQAYELQFCSLNGKVSASSAKDVKWATWSAKFGFCVQEIHQGVDYSNINAVCMNPTRTLIATGGDDQKIRLFNYPVTIPKQKHKVYTGHSSHVTRVRFNNNQHYLLSQGGNDRTIILWQMKGTQEEDQNDKVNQEEQEKQAVEQEGEEGEEEGEEKENWEEDISVPIAREDAKIQKKTEADDFELDENSGDQFMAVKPWLGAIKQPTVPYYKGKGKAPAVQLTLQYAHGYRVKDCRNNLIYLNESEICYHTAGVGVMMKINQNPKQQRFFDLHNDDIISMDWSEDKTNIFTGEMGAKPAIYCWDTNGTQKQLYKGVKKGVSAVAANQKYVVGAGLDDNHEVYLFDRKLGKLLGSDKGGRDVIICMRWIDESKFISIGVKHYKQWTVNDNKIKGKTANFSGICNILCSIAISDKKIYVGAGNGELQLWNSTSCSKHVKMHKAAINVICVHEGMLLTGSSDETIKIVEKDSLKQVIIIDCKLLLSSSVNRSVRGLDVFDNKVLVGTLGSEIYEIKSNQSIKESTSEGKFRLIGHYMSGHYAPNFVTNEVWGLGLLNQDSYVTCSDDGTLRVWDLNKKQQLGLVSLKFDSNLKPMVIDSKAKFLPDSVKGRCLAISPDKDIIIGCKDGTIKIISSNFKPIYSKELTKKQISHIKFSPDGSMVCIGAHDATLYLMGWQDSKLSLKFKCKKHSSYIKNFDFSRDGNLIHSTCGAYELLFFDTNTGKQVTSGATASRDEEWATWNVTLGWPVQGIYQQNMDGTDVNAVDRSNQKYKNDMRLLASGDDRGKVRILEYPCIVKNSEGVIGRGHSSHVTNVKFTRDDQYVISTGGEDQTIFQWKINAN